MKYLKVLLTSILSFSFFALKAQNSEDCLQNLSIFAEYAKVKNYNEAYEPWMKVRGECPKLNVAIYSYGERILKDRIKNLSLEEAEAAKIDLMKLYDNWILNFPTKRNVKVVGDILSSKAQSMLDYKIANKEEAYKIFDEAYSRDPLSFTNPKELYNYFKTYYELYKDGVDGITMEKLFIKFEEVSEKFEIESTNLSKKLDLILDSTNQRINHIFPGRITGHERK